MAICLLFFGGLFLVFSGCTAQIHYDRPARTNIYPTNYSELIPYRKLQRSDFRALHRPVPLSSASVASVCTHIISGPGARFRVHATSLDRSNQEARIVVNPGFRAVVNPLCSWWGGRAHPQAEILEHEQVHFAIMELYARQLNRRVAEIEQRGGFAGGVPVTTLQRMLNEATDSALEMHGQFDQAMFLSRESRSLRKAWLAKLHAALHQASAYAR